MQFNRVATPLFLLGFALDTAALTLGQPQGAALIGRPLSLSVPVSLGEGETADGFCAEAEVLQGASRIDPGRVTVAVESDPRSGGSRLRVRSSTVIEEPVVTLTVKAGCTTKSTRQYVLLADMPPEVALPAAAAMPSSPATSSSPSSRTTFPAVPSSDADRTRRRANAEAVLANAERSASARDLPRDPVPRPAAPPRASVAAGAASTVPTAAPRPAARTPQQAAVSPAVTGAGTGSRSRLQLDSAVPATAGSPALAASAATGAARTAGAALPVLPSMPAPLPAASAPATAAAASAPLAGASASVPAASAPVAATPTPEEAERAARLQAMEATLAALRAQTAENQRTLTDLRSELVASRESRYLNPIVYVLSGLLLLALVAIALLLASRRRAASAWWNDSVVREEEAIGPDGGAAPSGRSQPAPLVPGAVLAAQAHDVQDASDAGASHDDDVDLAPARNVNTEELFDVQQQSDFFLSLGQHAQAIAVLSEHIAENPQTSALAYLDLLRIHHSLGNRDAYGRVGHEFERAFNATLPSFDSFNDGGNGLEHYRSTLARITEQWPAPETLLLIEELVFRRPGTDGNEVFDLAAYQELLLLYAVAKEVIDPDSAPPAPVTPLSYLDTTAHGPTTAPSPLAAAPMPTRPAAFMPREPAAPAPASSATSDAPAAARLSSAEITTAPAPLMAATPSIYGALNAHADSDAGEDTRPGDLEGPTARVPLFPDAPLLPPAAPEPRRNPAMDAPVDTAMDTISELTRDTTLDSNLIDFELFDPEVEAKIAPKPTRY